MPLVSKFMVPPTDGIAILDAPRPRCTCILLVTASKPNQLDQYTQPFSISLTGIPSIITATLRWLNPLIVIRASPSPPPC